MEKRIGDEESIHLRAVRFGYEHPNGFLFNDIKKKYATHRENEWKLVDEYLNEAFRNKREGRNQTTPFVLLEILGNGNVDQCKYVLSYEAYFHYLEYKELIETRENAKSAQKYALWAIVIAIVTLVFSIVFSTWSIMSPVSLDRAQYLHLIKSIQREEYRR